MAFFAALASVPLVIVAVVAGLAKLRGSEKVSTELARLGVPQARIRLVGIVDLVGALGLIAGVFVPVIGALAALGWLAYWITAIVLHRKAGDPYEGLGGPLVFALLSAIVLGLQLLQFA